MAISLVSSSAAAAAAAAGRGRRRPPKTNNNNNSSNKNVKRLYLFWLMITIFSLVRTYYYYYSYYYYYDQNSYTGDKKAMTMAKEKEEETAAGGGGIWAPESNSIANAMTDVFQHLRSSNNTIAEGNNNNNKNQDQQQKQKQQQQQQQRHVQSNEKQPPRPRPRQRRWAYCFLMAGVDPDHGGYRGTMYTAMINKEILKQSNSSADVVLLVQMSQAYVQRLQKEKRNEKQQSHGGGGGSTSSSIEVRLPKHEEEWLQHMGIIIQYLELPVYQSFYSIQFEKFRILTLTQYTRVLYLDGDVLLFCPIDYLFELSDNDESHEIDDETDTDTEYNNNNNNDNDEINDVYDNGTIDAMTMTTATNTSNTTTTTTTAGKRKKKKATKFHLKENVIMAYTVEPAHGGFFMLQPKENDYDEHILSLIDRQENSALARLPPNYSAGKHRKLAFNQTLGWGHVITPPDHWHSISNGKKRTHDKTEWDFHGNFADQGLLYYWAKYYKQSTSIVIGREVENWISSTKSTNQRQHHHQHTTDTQPKLVPRYKQYNPITYEDEYDTEPVLEESWDESEFPLEKYHSTCPLMNLRNDRIDDNDDGDHDHDHHHLVDDNSTTNIIRRRTKRNIDFYDKTKFKNGLPYRHVKHFTGNAKPWMSEAYVPSHQKLRTWHLAYEEQVQRQQQEDGNENEDGRYVVGNITYNVLTKIHDPCEYWYYILHSIKYKYSRHNILEGVNMFNFTQNIPAAAYGKFPTLVMILQTLEEKKKRMKLNQA